MWTQKPPTKEQFADIASFLESNQQELVVSTVPSGHMYRADVMKRASAQFAKEHGSAYEMKVNINDKESKILNPKLKMLLRGIVEQYKKDSTFPK